MSEKLCFNATRHFNASHIPSTSWRKSCKQYGMICYRTPSTRPYWALSKDFELVWKLGANTLNTSSNKLFSQGFELLASCNSLKCQVSMFSFDFNTSTMMKLVIFIMPISKALRYGPCLNNSTVLPATHTNHTCLYSSAVRRHLPVVGTHCTYPLRDGQAELTCVAGYIPRWSSRTGNWIEPGYGLSLNRTRRRLTWLIETNALPLRQTTSQCLPTLHSQNF